MLLELLAAAALLSLGGNSAKSSSNHSQKGRSSFEEADSYFDRHGREHIVDDDGYCDECDDYHDDY